MRKRTDEEKAWCRENQPAMTVKDCREAFLAKFGWLPAAVTWSSWNARNGVVPKRVGRQPRRVCERRVRWSEEPEKEAWMLEHDHGQSSMAIGEAFEAEFGFRLTQTQISGFRSSHGTQTRQGRNNGRRKPVGTVSPTKNGYLKVKVADFPTVPGSKDNWRFVHHVEYERAHGPIPEGHDVMFADKDIRNFAPDNLVAVPHRLQGQLKQLEYHDRDELMAAVAWCRVQSKVRGLVFRPRRCATCGKVFAPKDAHAYSQPNKCCPECVEKGLHRSHIFRKDKNARTCEVCGKEYVGKRSDQRRCPECIAKAPAWSVEQQRRYR